MAGSETWLRRLLRSKEETALGPAIPHGRTRPSGPETFAEDSNDFALAMYGQLRQRPGNLFFSPFSIRTALGMTYSGARGDNCARSQGIWTSSLVVVATSQPGKQLPYRRQERSAGRQPLRVYA